MFKNLVSVMLIAFLFNLMLAGSAYADSKLDKKAQLADKVRQGVNKIGTGEAARVEVKLYDGTKIKGFIKEIKDDSFTVVNVKTNAEQNVPFPQVKQIKGNNLSTGAKVAIGLGILAGVLLIWLIFENYG